MLHNLTEKQTKIAKGIDEVVAGFSKDLAELKSSPALLTKSQRKATEEVVKMAGERLISAIKDLAHVQVGGLGGESNDVGSLIFEMSPREERKKFTPGKVAGIGEFSERSSFALRLTGFEQFGTYQLFIARDFSVYRDVDIQSPTPAMTLLTNDFFEDLLRRGQGGKFLATFSQFLLDRLENALSILGNPEERFKEIG